MSHKSNFTLVAVILMSASVLCVGTISTSHAKMPEPPTGTEHLQGPAITGKVILTVVDTATGGKQVLATIVDAKCKGDILPVVQVVISSTDPADFPYLTKDDLRYYRMPGGTSYLPEDCHDPGDDLIIETVTDFYNPGQDFPQGPIVADVVILAVVH